MGRLKGIITVGRTVVATFAADDANGGSSALLSAFVTRGDPDPMLDLVAPGAAAVQTRTVKDAFALRIEVDVPDEGASGQLTVAEDDAVLHDEPITEDVTWTYAIISDEHPPA